MSVVLIKNYDDDDDDENSIQAKHGSVETMDQC